MFKSNLKIKETNQKKIKLIWIENHKEFLEKSINIKTHHKFKSKKHNTFTEEVNKIALSVNNNKRIQSINSIEIYGFETSKDLVYKKE